MQTIFALLSTTATTLLFFYGVSQIQIDKRIRRDNGQIARRITVKGMTTGTFYL